MKYTKPPLTFEEQVELLKSRGLTIPDEKRTIRHLSNVSYYRLSAYMIPFREKDSDDFVEGTTWDDIYNLYKFDRKFRLLIFDEIERIEISLRTQLIYQLSHKYGSHWQDDSSIFKTITNQSTGQTLDVFADIQRHIGEQLQSNRKLPFIDHYLRTYSDPATPPSWMSIELLYFSELSRICSGLASRRDLMDIANFYNIKSDDVFLSWLHSINYVRNICAHHGRLWNIKLAIQPKKYYSSEKRIIWLASSEIANVQSSRIYYFMCVLLYLLQTINPNTKFRAHFHDLVKTYPNVPLEHMGFPENWENHKLWQKL